MHKSLLFVFVAVAGVGLAGASSCGPKISPETRELLDLPRNRRPTALAKYEPGKQVDLYVSAMLVKHPPQLELADVVAENGTRVLPILIRRIQKEKSEATKLDLFYVVVRIQEMRKANVLGQSGVIEVLESVASSMEDREWKETASGFLKRIRDAQPK